MLKFVTRRAWIDLVARVEKLEAAESSRFHHSIAPELAAVKHLHSPLIVMRAC